MTPKASRRLIFIAIAVSLLVHLIVAGWLQMPFALPQDSKQIVTISHIRVTRISQATPPPRSPAPRPSPSARASGPPHPVATNGRAAASPVTPAPATPTPPVAMPSAAQSCKSPNAPAGLSATPEPGDIPAETRAAATNGTTSVLVHLSADGTVASAAVAGSSGNGSLDLIALTMAKGAQYVPAYKDCKAIAADYTFAAKWVAW